MWDELDTFTVVHSLKDLEQAHVSRIYTFETYEGFFAPLYYHMPISYYQMTIFCFQKDDMKQRAVKKTLGKFDMKDESTILAVILYRMILLSCRKTG